MIKPLAWMLAALIAPACAAGSVIDVSTFGALPNDGADDAPAINTAIQSAAAGDTVLMGAGTYDIKQPIVAKSNFSLEGSSRAGTIVRWGGNTSNILMSMPAVANVNVTKFTLDGNNSTKVTQGVQAINSSGLNFNDFGVRNLAIRSGFGPHGIYFENSVTNSIIQNSVFTNIGTSSTWGAGIRMAWGSSNNQVINNTITSTGRGGILVNDGSTDAIIRNNTVTGSGGTGLGIEVWGESDRAIVEDNRIDHWLSIDGSNNLAVRRNVISDKSGIYKYTGLELVDASNNIFTDNLIDGGQKLGISISGPQPKENVLWARNTIKGASTWGVQIQGETGGASKQYFYQNTFEGTLRNSSQTLYAPQGHGVRVNGDARNIVFDSNIIRDNQGSGIQVVGTNVSGLEFVNNTITGNAIKAYEGAAAPASTWFANVVSGNGDNLTPAETGPNGWSLSTPSTMQINAGDSISFTFSSLGDQPARVLWDFGEGLPSTRLNPRYTYQNPGTYRLTMLAWDALGKASLNETMVEVGRPDGGIGITPGIPEPASAAAAWVLIAIAALRRR